MLYGLSQNEREREGRSRQFVDLTYKNTPPTSSSRVSIERFAKRLHQIFTVHWTHRSCGRRGILRLWCCHGRRRCRCCRRWDSTCWWWSISIGHVKGHSHFWLITSWRTKFTQKMRHSRRESKNCHTTSTYQNTKIIKLFLYFLFWLWIFAFELVFNFTLFQFYIAMNTKISS